MLRQFLVSFVNVLLGNTFDYSTKFVDFSQKKRLQQFNLSDIELRP